MGDYSAICAVSGLPITDSQLVVGLEVEPYRWESNKYRFVPKSWPVQGEYDFGGGIEGFNLSPNCALIHKTVWDNAPLFWHYLNRNKGPNFLNIPHILKKAKERLNGELKLLAVDPTAFSYRYNYIYTIQDHIFDTLKDAWSMGGNDLALTLRDMLDGKKDNVTNMPDQLSFLHRSAFGQLLVTKIAQNWTEQDQDTLYRLVCLWGGQSVTGRHIAPCLEPFVEQYPEYKQRIKLLTFFKKLATQLQKDQQSED